MSLRFINISIIKSKCTTKKSSKIIFSKQQQFILFNATTTQQFVIVCVLLYNENTQNYNNTFKYQEFRNFQKLQWKIAATIRIFLYYFVSLISQTHNLKKRLLLLVLYTNKPSTIIKVFFLRLHLQGIQKVKKNNNKIHTINVNRITTSYQSSFFQYESKRSKLNIKCMCTSRSKKKTAVVVS